MQSKFLDIIREKLPEGGMLMVSEKLGKSVSDAYSRFQNKYGNPKEAALIGLEIIEADAISRLEFVGEMRQKLNQN